MPQENLDLGHVELAAARFDGPQHLADAADTDGPHKKVDAVHIARHVTEDQARLATHHIQPDGAQNQAEEARRARINLILVNRLRHDSEKLSKEFLMSTRFIEHFSPLRDPRVERNQRYALMEILLLAVCAMLSAAEGWEAMEAFGKAKLD
ncbi:MAG: transposase family protein [Thiohalocapsa sp.]